jgi:type I restriction enzyme, S subunit
MAKKKESLTLEERLENALIPDWEQPYKVPSNWVWTRLESVAEIITGGTPSKNNSSYYGGTFPFIKPADLDQGRFISFASEYLTDEGKNVSRVIRRGATSVCCIGSIGKSGYLTFDATTNQQINSIIPDINDLFIYYLSCTEYFVQELWKRSSATTISIINKSKMSEIQIPLAPLAEQQRIVERIESLFTKIDEAKEKTQNALDSFESRRAAILHKAFTGELTKKWREENQVGEETRILKPLSAVCSSFQYGTSSKSVNEGSIAVVRMGNLQNGEIDWSDLVFSNSVDDNNKYKLKVGDVLFNRTNSPALVGKTSIYRGDFPAIFAGYLIRLNYGDELIGDYLNYMMNTHQAREYCNSVKSDGVNQSNINAKKIAAFIIPVPSIAEQTEIVRILDNIFEKEKQAKELVSVIEKIDFMKKAILARAFRGELGTNKPEEESALVLLKEMLSKEKITEQKPNKKQITIPNSISKQFKTDLEEQIYRVILENQNSNLNQILSWISSSKHLDAMEVITTLYEKGLIDKKDDFYTTK